MFADYLATKGSVTAFTRALAKQVFARGFCVNSVESGPILSPLIFSSCEKERIKNFREECYLKRAGQRVSLRRRLFSLRVSILLISLGRRCIRMEG